MGSIECYLQTGLELETIMTDTFSSTIGEIDKKWLDYHEHMVMVRNDPGIFLKIQ